MLFRVMPGKPFIFVVVEGNFTTMQWDVIGILLALSNGQYLLGVAKSWKSLQSFALCLVFFLCIDVVHILTPGTPPSCNACYKCFP